VDKTKPFEISKHVVWEAYKRVKANKGAAGIDEESITAFEENLKGNLYKIWNRMSSGSYFPPPVKVVEIPKKNGGMRTLGVPTVADRIAQMVAKMYFEPVVEPVFLPDSYGYRPGKSAIEAVADTRKRCWRPVVHCRSLEEADELLQQLHVRFRECGLELHPDKTCIVYCKDDDRRGEYPETTFDFLGYTFRPRRSKNRYGKFFINFTPAVCTKACKAMRQTIRHWYLQLKPDKELADISHMFNPVLRGWINYYGRF